MFIIRLFVNWRKLLNIHEEARRAFGGVKGPGRFWAGFGFSRWVPPSFVGSGQHAWPITLQRSFRPLLFPNPGDRLCSEKLPAGVSGFCDCDGDDLQGQGEPGYDPWSLARFFAIGPKS